MNFHQQHRKVQNHALNNLLMRLFLAGLSSAGTQPTNGCGVPLLQQMRPQLIHLRNGMVQPSTTVAMALPGVPYANALQELENQLLDDEETGDGNASSVITHGNSDWSDTLQNLMVVTRQCQKQISPSPTLSSSSSSPSSSLT